MTGYLFRYLETAIGPCGIVWGARGICGVQLPMGNRTRPVPASSSAMATSRRLRRLPRCNMRSTGSSNLLEGRPNDLRDVVLDLDGVPEFHRGVYDIARKIPPGKTMTYGDIARRLGGVELSRDVGQALGRNPCPIVVPCHRVLAAGGKPGGFSGQWRRRHQAEDARHRRRGGQPHAEPV